MTNLLMSVHVKTPASCSADELNTFCGHVNRGAEVASLTVNWVMDHGIKLVFVTTGAVLAAVGALKRPNAAYQQDCFRKARVADRWSLYSSELGWIFCDEAYRGGMSYRILDALLAQHEGRQSIYATVRTDNVRMIHPLEKRGFVVIGDSYCSKEHADARIALLVRTGTPAA